MRRVRSFHGPASRNLSPRPLFGAPSRVSRYVARFLLCLPRVLAVLAILAVADYVIRTLI